jgi:hypothetical protein
VVSGSRITSAWGNAVAADLAELWGAVGTGGITVEDAVDAVANVLVEGFGVDVVYDDANNRLTVGENRGEALQRVAVPSYFWATYYNDPASTVLSHDWERMQAGAPWVDIAIVNPSLGPGTSSNPDWVIQANRARAAGLKVLGYVKTNYSITAASAVKAEIDLYYNWYGVNGIFIDEVSYEAGTKQAYFLDLYNYIKAKGGLVIINPGIPAIDETYMQACDIVMNWEGAATTYLTTTPATTVGGGTFPLWTINYETRRFWHCIHDVADIAQRDLLLAKTIANRAGHIYLTPDSTITGDLNPYNSLPTDPFWSGLLDKLKISSAALRQTISAQTGTAYTPALIDENRLVTMSNAAVQTITLPQDSAVAFPIGARVEFLWLGVGKPSFAQGTGATIVSSGTSVTAPGMRIRYSTAAARKIAANTWLVDGDLA